MTPARAAAKETRLSSTIKSLNRQNGFRTTLKRLSCHKDFKITQAQTKVSFFYINPLLQAEFGAIFEAFHTFS